MGKGRSVERMEENAAALRSLVDTRSPRIVRDNLAGSTIRARRKGCPSIGDRSGKLLVTGYVAGKRGGLTALIVKCDCGFPEYMLEAQNFRTFKSTRCNACALKSSASTRKLYWGYSAILPDDEHRTRLLNRLSSAIGRCHNPTNKHYGNYGGRGVQVCQLWRDSRGEFLRYAITLKGWDSPELELDRIDVNGDYAPGNIRFISRRENMLNKRKVPELEARIAELEARIRHLELRPEEQVHGAIG